MGNTQSEASSASNPTNILNQKVVKGRHDRKEAETSVPVSDVSSKNLVTPHVDKEQRWGRFLTEDVRVISKRDPYLKVTNRRNCQTSSETQLKLEPPKTSPLKWPIHNVKCQSNHVSTLEKEQGEKKFTKSEVPPTETEDKHEDKIDVKKKGTGIVTLKTTAAMLPPTSGLPSLMPSQNSQLCAKATAHRTVSVNEHFSELPEKSLDVKLLNSNKPCEVQKTQQLDSVVNQPLKPTDTGAASPGCLLRNHRLNTKDMFDNVCAKAQPPETGPPLSGGNQKVVNKDKTQAVTVKPSLAAQLGLPKAHANTAPSVNIQEVNAENIKQDTAEAPNMVSLKIPQRKLPPLRKCQPSCKPKTKTPEAKHSAPLTSFSYADALKQSLPVKPPQKLSDDWPVSMQQRPSTVGKDFATAHKSLGKGEKSVSIKPFNGRTTKEEKQGGVWKTENIKGVQFRGRVQEIGHRNTEEVQEKMTATNLKRTEGRKQAAMDSDKPVHPPCYTFTDEKPKFDWISPNKIPNDHFQFSGSWNREEKTRPGRRKEQEHKVYDMFISWAGGTIPENLPNPSAKAQKQRNSCFFGAGKQGLSSETYPVPKQGKSKQKFTDSAQTYTFTNHEGIVKNKTGSTFLLPTLESASSKGHSSQQPMTDIPVYQVHPSRNTQTKTPQKQPKGKPAPCKNIFPSQIEAKDQTSFIHQITVFNLRKSSPPVPHIQQLQTGENTNSNNSEQALPASDKSPSQEPTISPETQNDSVSQDKDNLDGAPEDQPSKKWKDFYVDKLCTMKCICKHCPAKLPPNVISWLSVSENRLAEPMWITTLKLASSLVTGSKLLLDHPALTVPEDGTDDQNEQQQ
ncbi:gametogenetin [Mixophyes fleayi]|uniref:gametogenetin n=1 Tax=Mixophyes fleayi TaxID=3061075 RepID=UPI003F4E0CD5